MTLVITLKASDTSRNRRLLRRAKMREQAQAKAQAERRAAVMALSCSKRVIKATALPSTKEVETTGSICIPDVAIYHAGYRKSENITAR